MILGLVVPLVTRMQFLTIEIARNKAGLNSGHFKPRPKKAA